MNEKNIDHVEVLSIDGEKYVLGKSFSKLFGITPDNFDDWFKHQKKKWKLVCGIDYIDSEADVLFFFKTAARIFDYINKPKAGHQGRPSKSRHGYELDGYGLPILPPQKRRGTLINPYRI